MGRALRTTVPQLIASAKSPEITRAIQKQEYKENADKYLHAARSTISVGDKALVRQPRRDKLTTGFDPRPYVVLARKGTSLILQRGTSRPIMRNASLVHRIPKDIQTKDDNDEDDDSESCVPAQPGQNAHHQVPQIPVSVKPQRARNRPGHLNNFILD